MEVPTLRYRKEERGPPHFSDDSEGPERVCDLHKLTEQLCGRASAEVGNLPSDQPGHLHFHSG